MNFSQYVVLFNTINGYIDKLKPNDIKRSDFV